MVLYYEVINKNRRLYYKKEVFMKKKAFIIFALIVVLVPINLSALSLDIGATARYEGLVEDFSNTPENLTDFSNYSFGPDVRLKFGIFEIADVAPINVSQSDNDWWQLHNVLTAGVNFKLFNFINVGAGVGPASIVNLRVIDGFQLEDKHGNPFTLESFFLDPVLSYKATVDVLFDGLTLSAYYIVESNGVSIQNIIDDGFLPEKLMPADYNNGKVGVSLLISFL